MVELTISDSLFPVATGYHSFMSSAASGARHMGKRMPGQGSSGVRELKTEVLSETGLVGYL